MPPTRFSRVLEELFASTKQLKIFGILDEFAEKGFAILCFLLMSFSALPLPTGGITHVFEVIVMLLGLELAIGRKNVWLPAKWLRLNVPKKWEVSLFPRLIKLVRKVENFSRPRMSRLLESRVGTRLSGIFITVFAVFAFFAPPFSGLDTLPSLGIVFISLGLLLDDILLSIAGIIIGAIGATLVITLGSLIFHFL